MNKKEFITNRDVRTLIEFIAKNWDNEDAFKNKKKYKTLKIAHDAYTWKEKNLGATEIELNGYSKKIKEAYEQDDLQALFDVSKDILRWGGVLGSEKEGKKGNNNTLLDIQKDIKNEYKKVVDTWKSVNECNAYLTSKDITFKSNAGFTKIYSLLLDEFIIYDSRVAVAFTKIICAAFTKIPIVLKLNIPPGRNKNVVNANSDFFKPTYQNNYNHFYSNVKTSWILQEVLKLINKDTLSIRDIEAALFMFGEESK